MRILLTGITGQVGGALLTPLQGLGRVLAVARNELDLSHPNTIPGLLDRIAPDLIINPAAYTAVDRAEDEPELAYRINAEAPAQIAQWAAGRGVPLIHFSTDYVFDGRGERPWLEVDVTGPLSVYGASKLAGEEAVRLAQGPHLIVRTSWVYAASGTNFLQTIVRLARERKTLRIVADQLGAPTSARVIANAVSGIIRSSGLDLSRRFAHCGGLVNISASGETTWHNFAAMIVQGLRARGVKLSVESIVPIRSEDYPSKAKRPRNSRLDNSRMQRHFGIMMPHWHEALTAELDELAPNLTGSLRAHPTSS